MPKVVALCFLLPSSILATFHQVLVTIPNIGISYVRAAFRIFYLRIMKKAAAKIIPETS